MRWSPVSLYNNSLISLVEWSASMPSFYCRYTYKTLRSVGSTHSLLSPLGKPHRTFAVR